MRRPCTLVTLAVALAAGAGCVSTANDQPVHSDGSLITSAAPLSDTPSYTTPDVQSVTGLDRSAWPVMVFNVPQQESEFQPRYRSAALSYARTSATQRGEYPTPETAGEDITDGSRGQQALEGVVSPFHAIGELILMIPRAIIAPPNTPTRGPLEPVDRVPPKAASAPSTLPPAATPPAAAPVPAPAPAPSPAPTQPPAEGAAQ